ncbi:MAG: hypothetical protein K8H89_11325 [Flavobacteriales bacterium]|nr:hypothetical protein [Flavobacteriales bacterium]
MEWHPISRAQLQVLIEEGLEHADDKVLAAWASVRVEPVKWQCSPFGDAGGGFWVVAVRDGTVTWYNDIEGGFNVCRWTVAGVIDEYGCAEQDFSAYLSSLVQKRQTDISQGLVPEELSRDGCIVKRQTTYWTLTDRDGRSWRVHFNGKAEMNFLSAAYGSLSINDQHVLLNHHNQPCSSLYFKGKSNNPEELLAALRSKVAELTDGWRRLEEYMEPTLRLADGYGLLMEGPNSLVLALREVLTSFGVTSTTLESRTGAKPLLRLLLLDHNYVVAEGFRFELLLSEAS